MSPRRRRGHGLAIVLMTLLATVALLSVSSANRNPHTAPALTSPAALATGVTGSQFQAGSIISDAVFYNGSTMNATSIQAFLNQQAPSSCPGTTCLNAFHMATTSQPAESGLCSAYAGKPSETAAQIFANVAIACNVNPEALLVIAQKESSAVTSSSPNYTTTMGYGCPDSTGCATKYFGFFNQVYLAARQFKLYRLHPDNYGYVAGESNFILYNPKVSCGGSQVFIQNQATAGLYDYTPYQPDAAALANLHGTGDSCSAYGNRNFWVFFNSWFGTAAGLPAAPQPYDRGGLLGTKTDHSIWYYTNKGTMPPLAAGVQVASSPQLSGVVGAGDLTGDGLADLLTATSSGALWLYKNTGTILPYDAPVEIGASGWQRFNRIVVADLTGDGRADLLMTQPSGAANIYLNSGNPANPVGKSIALGGNWNTFTSLTAGDVNSDGFADILGMKADGSLWILPGASNPSRPFGTWSRLGTPNLAGYNAIVADDTNADGHTDLVARRPDGSLWLFLNSGSATSPYGTATQIGASGWSQFTTLQSITVPVPHRKEQANLVVRNPAGTASLSTFTDAPPATSFTASSVIGASGWEAYRLVVAANLSGDGRADLVAVDKAGTAWLYKNTGVAAHPYSTRVQIATGWGTLQTLFAGDVNGDGRDDLVARTTTGVLDLFVSTGSSTAPFGKAVQIGTGFGSWHTLALADTNGDHKADLLAVSSAGVLVEFTGSGSTVHPFSTSVTIGTSSTWQQYSHLVAITHATAAGTSPADLVAIAPDGSGRLFRNTGLATRPYLTSVALAGKPWAGQVIVSGGPATGSGRTDTVGATAAGLLRLNTNHGTDVFANPTVIGTTGWSGYNSIGLGDITGDGRNDLIATTAAGAFSIYFAGTDPTHPFGSPVLIQATGWDAWNRTLVGDVTGDGLADLVTTTSAGALWLYQASTTVNHPYGGVPKRQIGSGWQDFTQLALGDVTGDGLDDLVGLKADGSLWLATNQHNPLTPFGAPVQIGTGFQLYNHLLLGDVNGDGSADLVGVRPDGTAWFCGNIKPLYPTTTAPFQACVPTTPGSWNSYDLAAL